MTEPQPQPTLDGQRLIENWKGAVSFHGQATLRLTNASADLKTATKALADWMLPADAMPDEKICIWFGDSLIQVKVPCFGLMPVITVRKRGRSTL